MQFRAIEQRPSGDISSISQTNDQRLFMTNKQPLNFTDHQRK